MNTVRSCDEATAPVPVRVEVEASERLTRDYARLTGARHHASSAGLWVVLARRAMGDVLTVPPGGVLLSIACECGSVPDLPGVAVDVRQHSRPTKDGRRVLTVTCELAHSATVTFVMLVSADAPESPALPPSDAGDRRAAVPTLPRGTGPLTVDLDLARAWSRLTDDGNPLHSSPSYAAGSRFGVPIVHGHYLAALVGDRVQLDSGRAVPWACTFVAPVPVGASFEIELENGPHGIHGALRHDRSAAVRISTDPQTQERRK